VMRMKDGGKLICKAMPYACMLHQASPDHVVGLHADWYFVLKWVMLIIT
jgi:hypothetical protein